MLHCHEKNRWDCLYNLKGEKESPRLSWNGDLSLSPYVPAYLKSYSIYKAQISWNLLPSQLQDCFPLQKGKVYNVNQTSRLTAAGSMVSLLFCWNHNSAYRPPFDRRTSWGPCSITFPFSKTIIWKFKFETGFIREKMKPTSSCHSRVYWEAL